MTLKVKVWSLFPTRFARRRRRRDLVNNGYGSIIAFLDTNNCLPPSYMVWFKMRPKPLTVTRDSAFDDIPHLYPLTLVCFENYGPDLSYRPSAALMAINQAMINAGQQSGMTPPPPQINPTGFPNSHVPIAAPADASAIDLTGDSDGEEVSWVHGWERICIF